MQDLTTISDTNLKIRIEKLVRHERKITTLLLAHIAEVERRKLHLSWGFSSLFEYLSRGLGYSESAAYRRMQAARAMKQMPELEEKLESGSVNLSQIVLVQAAVKCEQKETGRFVSIERKRDIFLRLENKTKMETQKILDSELVLPERTAIETHKKDDSVELTLRLPKEVYDLLQEMKSVYSHIEPNADWVAILKLMALEIKRKKGRALDAQKETHGPDMTRSFATKKKCRGNNISTSVRRFIFARDQGRCQFRGSDGRLCASPFQLQVDHIQPRFSGGSNEPENLRLLCAAHNRFRYRQGL